ncbi:hypothetical protein POM88_021992 [Heracleum sosnowskyi]|uniref:DUF4283 domain-containing protein n=1 Tax=Heracleum sosnowskyi TaxID=360622 RepID=A0AAD8MTC0_9APIA|nr:hypothetical protein POM88_021992 [Heracleum sosnowskyi]
MGSQDSNVASSGIPVDRDGNPLEFGVFGGLEVPFMVAGSGSLKNVQKSASGGIPIEAVLVEDVNSSDEECPITPEEEAWLANHTTNPAVRAAFAINKSEREELFAARKRMQEMEKFLAIKGFSVAEFDRECMEELDNFNSGLNNLECIVRSRDEFGLPLFATKVDVGASGSKTRNTSIDGQICLAQFFVPFGTQDKGCTSGIKDDTGNAKKNEKAENIATAEMPKTTWSQVVKNPSSPCNNLSFDYVPMPAGVKIVSPPDEVLRKGNEKFKSCIVGTFTREAPPFSRVAAFAHNVWDKRGLVHISQNDSRTFVFKFDSLVNMNSALAKGTWYLGSSPMLVHAWGTKVGEKNTMPLWVKFENMPDSYWTWDGLSFLASVIGNPLSADDMTSRLEILPFAKLCVEYKIGDDLPSTIEVEVLDLVSEVKHIEEVKTTGIESTGTPLQNSSSVAQESTLQGHEPPIAEIENKETVIVQGDPRPNVSLEEDITDTVSNKGGNDWTTVQSRKSKLTASTENASKNAKDFTAPKLPIYSALAKSINKGKQKKARRSGGVRSPSH